MTEAIAFAVVVPLFAVPSTYLRCAALGVLVLRILWRPWPDQAAWIAWVAWQGSRWVPSLSKHALAFARCWRVCFVGLPSRGWATDADLVVRFLSVRGVDMASQGHYSLRACICLAPQAKALIDPQDRFTSTTHNLFMGNPVDVVDLSASGTLQRKLCKGSEYCVRMELFFLQQVNGVAETLLSSRKLLILNPGIEASNLHCEVCLVALDGDGKHFCVVELELCLTTLDRIGGDCKPAAVGPHRWPASFPGGCLFKEDQCCGLMTEDGCMPCFHQFANDIRLQRFIKLACGSGSANPAPLLEELRVPGLPRSLILEELATDFLPWSDFPILVERRGRATAARAPLGQQKASTADPDVMRPSQEHIVVLVPGHLEGAADMIPLRNHLALLVPGAKFLLASRAIDGGTSPPPGNQSSIAGHDDLHYIAVRLASEVAKYISDLPVAASLGRLSFVAHGTGGLVVRAALPWLKEYSSKLSVLVTFSTPHLGRWPGDMSCIHRLFVWCLRTRFPSAYLEQLALNDARTKYDSFVYRLSLEPTFQLFKTAVLVTARQDWSIPFHSAQCQAPPIRKGFACGQCKRRMSPYMEEVNVDVVTPVRLGDVFNFCKKRAVHEDVTRRMADNLLKAHAHENLIRVEVDFDLTGWLSESFLGRIAHNRLMESSAFLRTFAHAYGDLLW